MPWYRRHGKDFFPMTEEEFIKKMDTGYFLHSSHRIYVIILYYTGVRKMEALRALRKQFRITEDKIYFDVGTRLKKGLHTAPLPMLKNKKYIDELEAYLKTKDTDEKLFNFSPSTAFRIVDRAFDKYPHYFRLTKITLLFRKGFTIDQVRSWTGHKALGSLTPYVGYSNVEDMA
jgi:integrase